MICSIIKTLSDGREVKHVIGGKVSIDGNEEIFSAEDILGRSDVFLAFKREHNICIAKCPDYENVILICDSSESSVLVTPVFDLVDKFMTEQHLDNLPSQASQIFITRLMNMNMDKDTAVCILTLCIVYRAYLSEERIYGTVNIGIDFYDNNFFEETKNFIEALKTESTWPFKTISNSENVTKFQNTEEDELFIEIPLRQLLTDDDVNVKSFLPKKSELFNPYGAMTLDDMTTYKDPGVKFPVDMFPRVEGLQQNNELQIQENEKKYYDSLIEWVKFNMRADADTDIDVEPSNPNIDGISQEYLINLADYLYSWNWDHNPNIPFYDEEKEEQGYLSDENDDTIKSSYIHRATKREKDAMAAGMTDLSDLKEIHINAIAVLNDFLREASLNIGYRAYVEAIIKLARWGSRKPTVLFFEDYPLVFDLTENKIKQYIGYIDNYDLQQVNGCDAVALCAIYDTSVFADKSYLRKFGYEYDQLIAPIGVLGKKTYINKSNNGPENLTFDVYYSIIDIVKSYVTGTDEFKLDGISYDGSKFVCSDELVCDKSITLGKLMQAYENNRNNLMLNPFCVSTSLQNLYMDLGVTLGSSDAPLHHFSLLRSKQRTTDFQNDIHLNKFDSKSDLEQKRQKREIRLLKYAVETEVASVIIPVFVTASVKLSSTQEYNLSDVLNVYKNTMLELNYIDESSFMMDYTAKEVTKSLRDAVGYTGDNSSVNSMNLFSNNAAGDEKKVVENGNSSEESEIKVQESSVKSEETTRKQENFSVASEASVVAQISFVKEIADDDVFIRLTDRNKTVIGGCAIRKHRIIKKDGSVAETNYYIFVDDSVIASIPDTRVKSTQKFNAVVPLIINDILMLEGKKPERMSAFFADFKTLLYYRDKTKELLTKELM